MTTSTGERMGGTGLTSSTYQGDRRPQDFYTNEVQIASFTFLPSKTIEGAGERQHTNKQRMLQHHERGHMMHEMRQDIRHAKDSLYSKVHDV
jgi:hypothetical protein